MTDASSFNYQVGGSLPADAPSYVERQCDREYYDLLKERKYCYVFNCRQMGKSSLRVRVTHKLQAEGFVCATIDPQKIGVEVTCEQWYASAIRSLVGDLNLKNKFDLRSWIRERELLSPVQRFAEFIETVVLQEIDAPIVIFVEEIDRLLSLKFGMDDFFGLVRSFFEDRPTKPEYNRLTFSFLGVATPTDLIQSHNTSAFNIGYAVEMAGFTLTEAGRLVQGLASKVANPQDYLEAAIAWTGGQPFLIQRLLGIIGQELAGIAPPENVALWVENLVQERIVKNWESQDAPPHLTTIRDRVLSVEEKLRGRMLGCYQQVLADGELADDRSEERSKLRLTGLVVRRDGRLISYNPIYGAVFNNAWVEGQLADLRPDFYGSAFRAWQDAEQKNGFLLRGEALQNADEWARGKRLSDADEEFLRESREVEKIESNLKLEAEQQAREIAEEKAIILGEAKLKADRRVLVGSGFLVVAILAAVVAGVSATKFVNEANVKIDRTEKEAKDKLTNADLSVETAQKNADNIKKVSQKDARDAAQKVRDANEKKKEADLKVEEAQKNLESAKAEAEKVSQDSAEKVSAAQAKIVDAEAQLNQAQDKAQKVQQEAEINLISALSISSESSFTAEQELDALFSAVKAGVKLKSIQKLATNDLTELQKSVYNSLQQSVYGLEERNRIEQNSVIRSVSFSPNGKLIATGDFDGKVKLWNKDGSLLRILEKHTDVVNNVVFSHNGELIASGGIDKTLRIWRQSDGALLHEIKGHQTPINSISFSLDGKKIVSTGAIEKQLIELKIWDISNEKIVTNIQKPYDGMISAISFSPDGRMLATTGYDLPPWQGRIKLWDLDGNLVKTFNVEPVFLRSIQFSQDGKSIICAGDSGNIVLLQLADGKLIKKLKAHEDWALGAQFSPNNQTFASISNNGNVKLWSLDGSLIRVLSGHKDAVYSLAFSHDGNTLITSSADKILKFWNIQGYFLKSLDGQIGSAHLGISFSPDGKTLTSASFDPVSGKWTAKLWNLSGQLLWIYANYGDSIRTIRFSPNGQYIATASWDRTVKILTKNGKLLTNFTKHTGPVDAVAFSPTNNEIVASAGYDNKIYLWNVNSGEILQTIEYPGEQVYRVNFSPDGRILASASWDRKIKLWNLSDGKLLKTFDGHDNWLYGLAFSPDGKIIASGSKDRTVKLWSIDGTLLHNLKGHKEGINDVAFSNDGTLIASASNDNTIKLWSRDGNLVKTLKHSSGVYGVDFSPDSKTVASASWAGDGSIKIWSTEILDMDRLLERGCELLNDYLANNPNASDEDRQMCGIAPRQK